MPSSPALTSSGVIARSLSPHLWRTAARLDLEAAASHRSRRSRRPSVQWHGPCSMGSVFRNTSAKPGTEVFIVDSCPAAAIALGAHRPSEESTYVLCRSENERHAEFAARV